VPVRGLFQGRRRLDGVGFAGCEEVGVIDVQQVRELIELMVEHDLTEIRVKQGDTTVSLRKGPDGGVSVLPAPVVQTAAPPATTVEATPAVAEPAAEPAEDEGLVAVTSPMVGSFYTGPDPDSPPFVKVGQEVSPDTTVCIIEAMKVFNEIKAEVAGTVERIVAANEQAVEFGETLILIRPKG
jgi:acetyl-CoA carboxylase biotin carboxyl carrier protein